MKVRVRQGDTFWEYSRLFKVPLPLIIDSNRKIDPLKLQVNEEITIPGFVCTKHIIQPHDSLWQFAAARSLQIEALILLNPDIDINQLTPGEVIILPNRVTNAIVDRAKMYPFTTLQTDIQKLIEIYPFVTCKEIGTSVLGKPLYMLKIGSGPKKVQMNASFHANEWITSVILMSLMNEYLLSLVNNVTVRGLSTFPFYKSVELSIIPMVNPDGVDLVLNGPPAGDNGSVLSINEGNSDFIHWKANIRGVDLNNQFPANWEIERARKEPKLPAPRDFPGFSPLTEPEAIAMAELARHSNFHRMVAFHTQGKEFYWGYEGKEPRESKRIAEEFERVSGYKAVRYIDSHAGYKDWFIQEFQKAAFTLELGEGINPLPISQAEEIFEDVLGIFLASLYI